MSVEHDEELLCAGLVLALDQAKRLPCFAHHDVPLLDLPVQRVERTQRALHLAHGIDHDASILRLGLAAPRASAHTEP